MKKYLIHSMRLIYGFFIPSVLFCMIYEMTNRSSKQAFIYSLLFFIPLIVCYITVEKVKNVIQYAFICACLSAGMLALFLYLKYEILDLVIGILFMVVLILNFFMARVRKVVCWIVSPHFAVLAFYGLSCFYGAHIGSTFMIRLCSFAAGISFLIINLAKNDQNMKEILHTFSNLERLPSQKIKRNNNRILMIYSFLVSGVMITAPYLKMDQVILAFGEGFRKLLAWILSFFIKETKEDIVLEEMLEKESSGFVFPKPEGEKSLLLEIIDRMIQYAAWIVLILFIGFIIFSLIRKLLQLYHQFNDHLEENGDLVEDLRVTVKTEDRIQEKGKKREGLFFQLSPDARIRKHYKKKILKEKKEDLRPSWTPSELENMVELSVENREKFHFYYEKARYAKESCTREEQQEMLRI